MSSRTSRRNACSSSASVRRLGDLGVVAAGADRLTVQEHFFGCAAGHAPGGAYLPGMEIPRIFEATEAHAPAEKPPSVTRCCAPWPRAAPLSD